MPDALPTKYFSAVRIPLLLLLGLVSFNTCIAQVDLQIERRAMVNGEAHGVSERLEIALAALPASTPPVEQARILELLGEQYHRLSDIGHAKRLWDEALNLRQQAYGDSSAEAAVGYAYRARYHNYMAASQYDHQELALQVAARAKRLLNARNGLIEPSERTFLLREFAYAFKVAANAWKEQEHHKQTHARAYFREALRSATAARDTIWTAQILHDIGNTFTDEAGWDGLPVPKHAIVDSARICYQRSIALMTAAGSGASEAVMMDHYTTALLYKYAYGPDSIAISLAAFDRALRTMLQQAGQNATVDPLHYDARITNPAQMVELLYQRADLQQCWPDPSTHLQQLNDAIRSIQAAVPYWEQMLRNYKSSDLEKVTGSYSHFPFRLGSKLFLQRYHLAGHSEDLHTAFLWSERNRNALVQRKRIRAGLDPIATDDIAMERSKVMAPNGTVIIAFNHSGIGGAFVIDENGLSVTALEEIPIDPDMNSGKFDAFNIADPAWTPEHYAREGFRWYKLLLAPVLEQHPAETIIIVPYGSLALLTFDALCTSPKATQWKDVAYLSRTHTVRYARSVAEALRPSAECTRRNAFFATAQVDSLAELPFARNLIERLSSSFNGSEWNSALDGTALSNALNVQGLLHIATHGVNPAVPDAAPFLLLNGGPWSAVGLHDQQIHRTLAVLSTCSSGSGRNYQGEGVMSIAHAFLGAGTKSVVHTLWPVDDRTTSEILEEFYAALDEGLPATKALHRAKLDFLKRHSEDGLAHPFYWSGIVLSGTDVELEPREEYAWCFAGSAALLLIGVGYTFSRRAKSERARAAN